MAQCLDAIDDANSEEYDSDITTVKRRIDSSCNSQTSRTVPELPYDKEFHLFVCYTDSNAVDVRLIIQNLERDGIKCCFHERDFTAGHNIFQNINYAIEKSMGILIVLSEDFVTDSHVFCHHEIEQALHAKITNGYSVIPIKIEPCSVPDTLKYISYIDAQETDVDEMHMLISDAFLRNVWQAEQNETNGQTVDCPLMSYTVGWYFLSLSRYKLEIDAERRNDIWEKGFQISDGRIDEIEAIISDSIYVKYRHVFKLRLRLTNLVFVMLLLLNIVFSQIGIILTSGRDKDGSQAPRARNCSILTIICTVVLWAICIFAEVLGNRYKFKHWKGLKSGIQERSKKDIKRALWRRINSKSARQDNFFVVFDTKEDTLKIVRFNIKPCQDVFVRRCGHKEALIKHIGPGETHLEYAERLFDLYLRENSHALTARSNIYSRHRMANGASCLCLLVEEWIL